MKEVVIIDGVRSPIGKFGGALSKVRPDDLLAENLGKPSLWVNIKDLWYWGLASLPCGRKPLW